MEQREDLEVRRVSKVDFEELRTEISNSLDSLLNGKVDASFKSLLTVYRRNFSDDELIFNDLNLMELATKANGYLSQTSLNELDGTVYQLEFLFGYLYLFSSKEDTSTKTRRMKAFSYLMRSDDKTSTSLTNYFLARCFFLQQQLTFSEKMIDLAIKDEVHPRNYLLKAKIVNPLIPENPCSNNYMFLRNILGSFEMDNHSVSTYELIVEYCKAQKTEFPLPPIDEFRNRVESNDEEWLARINALLKRYFCRNPKTGGSNPLGVDVRNDYLIWWIGKGVTQKEWKPPVRKRLYDEEDDYDGMVYPDNRNVNETVCPACGDNPCMCSDPGW